MAGTPWRPSPVRQGARAWAVVLHGWPRPGGGPAAGFDVKVFGG